MSREITIEEVKKHKRKNGVWMIIHNDVYDVTSFLNEHPGGEETLLMYAGKDGTQGFEDVAHSEDARDLMKKYKIGTLPIDQRNKPIEPCCPHLPRMSKEEKTWRTFDGSSGSQSQSIKSNKKASQEPRHSGRVSSITVPNEGRPRCRPRGPPCEGTSYKWALIALAGALLIGIVLKKYLTK